MREAITPLYVVGYNTWNMYCDQRNTTRHDPVRHFNEGAAPRVFCAGTNPETILEAAKRGLIGALMDEYGESFREQVGSISWDDEGWETLESGRRNRVVDCYSSRNSNAGMEFVGTVIVQEVRLLRKEPSGESPTA